MLKLFLSTSFNKKLSVSDNRSRRTINSRCRQPGQSSSLGQINKRSEGFAPTLLPGQCAVPVLRCQPVDNIQPSTDLKPCEPSSTLTEPSAALLLAFLASSASSLIATQCLVESVLEIYISGQSFASTQIALKIATFSGPTSSGSPILSAPDEDVIAAWVALIMLTLQELGIPGPTDLVEAGATEEQTRFLQGMRAYVKHTLIMYDNGYTLERLRGLQSMVQQEDGGAVQRVMQQYTRLVLLTVEVVASMRLPCTRGPLGITPIQAPSGYTLAFHQGPLACPISRTLVLNPDGPLTIQPLRAIAMRSLICFIGAVLGSAYSLQRFAHSTIEAYSQGWGADEVFQQLRDSDFLQSGGLVPVTLPSAQSYNADEAPSDGPEATEGLAEGVVLPPAEQRYQDVNKQLFGLWLSTGYVTLAQLGLYYPGVGEREGWAWAGAGDAVEAVGLDSFVRGAVRKAREELSLHGCTSGGIESEFSFTSEPIGDLSRSISDLARTECSPEDASATISVFNDPELGNRDDLVTSWLQQRPEIEGLMEAEREAAAVEFMASNKLRGQTLPVLVKVEDEELAASSSGVRIFMQQASLVGELMRVAKELYKIT
ncbi:hypothetical protein CEUSTIGMA_g4119.t1 [Chlamydomonas eustigma]|uniref:Uncharacterized protein n=1 Tax=Chlamydomonas eustigma TaxID=1157962 RepID=A0A250X0S1_9CHLO|nr:hypothetical protein CEUSTIGMA_g4119.t1 [Chlamydomonas eustigma]|eukprot:GAX76673.1 hypothetical protein CEUSTIGMA_g4119.t1 [Chlamydomonas eustigma]